MLFAILWVLFSLVVAGVAKQTGRNPGVWFFIAFLTSPAIGGLILLIAFLFNGKVVREQPKVVTTGMFSNYLAAYNYVNEYYTIDTDYRAEAASDLFKYATCREDCDKLIAKYVN